MHFSHQDPSIFIIALELNMLRLDWKMSTKCSCVWTVGPQLLVLVWEVMVLWGCRTEFTNINH